MTSATEARMRRRNTAEQSATDAGSLIRAAREGFGMTQKQLATAIYELGYRANVPESVISAIEHNKRPVPWLMRPLIERVLWITLPPAQRPRVGRKKAAQ